MERNAQGRERAEVQCGERAEVQYALELYLPGLLRDEMPELVARARAAADEMQRLGTPVRFLHLIALPGDEICFLLFEASFEELAAEAADRASIAFERVVAMEMAVDDG
jgi:hypothetical protein